MYLHVLSTGVLRRALQRWQSARNTRVLFRLRTEQAAIHSEHTLMRRCFRAWQRHQQTAVRKAVSIAYMGCMSRIVSVLRVTMEVVYYCM